MLFSVNSFKYFVIKIFLVLICLSLTSCDKKHKRHSEVRGLMGTTIQVDVCATRQQKKYLEEAYEDLWERLEEISWRMNVYDDQSDLAKIHAAQGKEVRIPIDTHKLIRDSLTLSAVTEGAFDITIYPLMELWREAEKNQRVPTQKEIDEILERVGSKKVQLIGDDRVKLSHPEMKLDLGGIAKGFAIDEAARILREKDLENFMIDAGGDVYVGGTNCKGYTWAIGIRDPRDTTKVIDIVYLKNKAITTSGNYEQYFEINDKKYSHIINPKEGLPQQRVVSASVIANSAKIADAISTAMCILSPKKGERLMKILGDSYASLSVIQDEEKDQIDIRKSPLYTVYQQRQRMRK